MEEKCSDGIQGDRGPQLLSDQCQGRKEAWDWAQGINTQSSSFPILLAPVVSSHWLNPTGSQMARGSEQCCSRGHPDRQRSGQKNTENGSWKEEGGREQEHVTVVEKNHTSIYKTLERILCICISFIYMRILCNINYVK